MEGKGQRPQSDVRPHLHLSFPLISSHPPALLTFSLPKVRSWNAQVSLIYPRKLGLIWNQGTSGLSLSSAEITGIRHFRYHPASPSLLVTTLSPSGLCLASQQGSHLVLPDSFTSYAHLATNHMVFSLAAFGVFIYSLIHLTNIFLF